MIKWNPGPGTQQYIYRYITGKLKLQTIKNSLPLNGPAKESRLPKYSILNSLTSLYANYSGSDKSLVDISN